MSVFYDTNQLYIRLHNYNYYYLYKQCFYCTYSGKSGVDLPKFLPELPRCIGVLLRFMECLECAEDTLTGVSVAFLLNMAPKDSLSTNLALFGKGET